VLELREVDSEEARGDRALERLLSPAFNAKPSADAHVEHVPTQSHGAGRDGAEIYGVSARVSPLMLLWHSPST
jgi:hypothetical protein